MKVVLFCGGMGLRLREYSARVPKPMIPVGPQPILWYVMSYYRYYGHDEFVLCLGYQGKVIRDYLLATGAKRESIGTLPEGHAYEVLVHPREGWRATCVASGLSASVGQRLRVVRPLLDGDERFLANYSDVLSDVPLPLIVNELDNPAVVASMLCVRPGYSCHVMAWAEEGSTQISGIADMTRSSMWINGGFFAFRHSIFDVLREGEELVEQPFGRLIARGALAGVRYPGFWAPMDTFKEKQQFDQMYERGERPWCVWLPHADESDALAAG
jgi:glucose-1-phosphate cytidylyltransferase